MAYIAGVSGGIEFQEEKSADITPSANWSGAYTKYSEINPDTGYDAMEKVKVRTPMLRNYTLMNVSQVDTPGTVYDGNTSRSNSAKMLRVAPSKDGMSYTNSYLEVPASSAMGNATAADVASGKTFSSGNGIALTGTGQMAEDLKLKTLFTTQNVTIDPKYYDGDTEVQGSGNYLLINPTKDGVVHKQTLTYNGYILGKDSKMGNAAASDVLASKTFSSGSGIYQTGTIQTRSASSETISAAKTYQPGYYPNGWTVTPQGGTSGMEMHTDVFLLSKRPTNPSHPSELRQEYTLSFEPKMIFVSLDSSDSDYNRYADNSFSAYFGTYMYSSGNAYYRSDGSWGGVASYVGMIYSVSGNKLTMNKYTGRSAKMKYIAFS